MQQNDPNVLHPGHAPTPFTADEIRAGCPLGRTITLSVDGDGGSFLRTIRFLAVDADGADQESLATTKEGERLGEPSTARTSWVELQEHASFPSDATVIEVEALNTPLGRLECRVYEVDQDGEKSRFWFAVDRPGMPVKIQTHVGERVTSTVTMIEDTVR